MTEFLYKLYKTYHNICTDTRTVNKRAIFFALKGANFDGNKFANDALQKGCSYAVIDDPKYKKNDQYILVNDVLSELQNLAKHHRKQLVIPFIGITGSNGKTTTKELVNVVLQKKYKTFATHGNLNNHIGVPLSVLSVTDDIEIAIIEMGANHQREIALLCEIARPDYGLITNIGKAHLEGFGGIKGVKKAKGELFDFLKERGGKVFLNADAEVLVEMAGSIPAITYGSYDNCYASGNYFAADPYVRLAWNCQTKNAHNMILETSIVGKYNFSNIMAAICIGNFFDVETEKINEAIKNYAPLNNRSQMVKTEKNTILLDAYNANPSSMEEAIKNFTAMKGDNKVYILGDMLELGAETEAEHQHIIDVVNQVNPHRVFLVGTYFPATDNSFECFLNSEELKSFLSSQKIIDCNILIKGSRGIKLEKIVEVL